MVKIGEDEMMARKSGVGIQWFLIAVILLVVIASVIVNGHLNGADGEIMAPGAEGYFNNSFEIL